MKKTAQDWYLLKPFPFRMLLWDVGEVAPAGSSIKYLKWYASPVNCFRTPSIFLMKESTSPLSTIASKNVNTTFAINQIHSL